MLLGLGEQSTESTEYTLDAESGNFVITGTAAELQHNVSFSRLAPDSIAASTNLNGVVANIQDDPDSPDGSWLTATVPTSATELRVTFPTPNADPNGAQNFRLLLRKTTGDGIPTVDVELWQNGVSRSTLLNDTAVTSLTGQVNQADWDASGLSGTLDGSDVECRVISTPGAGASLPAYGAAGTLFDDTFVPHTHELIPMPAHAVGDLLICLVVLRNDSNDGSFYDTNGVGGSGSWTLENNSGNMYGGAQSARLAFSWKIAASTTEQVSILTSGGVQGNRIHARVYKFTSSTGFNASPIQDIGTAVTGTLSGSQDMTMPTVAAGGTNELALCLYGISESSTQATPTGQSGATWTEPLGEDATTSCTSGIFIADDSDGGGVSGGTSASGAESGVWVALGLRLVPAGAAGNTVEIGAIEWNARSLAAQQYTLDVESGSFLIAGTSASLEQHLIMDAALGSLALTGQDATLQFISTLAADAGGYSISGQAASLQKGSILAAVSESFSVNGQVAGLQVGRVIDAGQGSFAVVGTAADLLNAFIILVDSGSYSIVGTAIDGVRSLILSVGTGAFVTSGQDAALLSAKLIAVDSANYNIVGQSASLQSERVLEASQGSISVNGAAAALTAGKLLAASPGSYTVIGTDAQGIRVLIISANAGSYAIAGQDIAPMRSLIMNAEPRTYAITGSEAELQYTSVGHFMLNVDPGSFIISGQPAGLLRDLVLFAEPVSFIVSGQEATLGRVIAIAIDSGMLTVAGSDVDILRSQILQAGLGAINVSGSSAEFVRALILDVANGIYVVTGTDAGLIYSEEILPPLRTICLIGTNVTIVNLSGKVVN